MLTNHRRDSKPTSPEIEQIFLDHFHNQGYRVVPGSSLMDDSLPMSFVMSAGLVQVERAAALVGSPYGGRFAMVQNCFRHFDLDRVGRDDIHLSFFRMAGAFTFGDIDHNERIALLWKILTQDYGLLPENLWVTYFKGDSVAGIPFAKDIETYQAWLEAGVSPSHLVGLGGESNFWKQNAQMMGPEHASKCGPNTEVYYDQGASKGCGLGCLPGCNCGRFIEFANTLLITWYIDQARSEYAPLEIPFVETVIGVERLAMLLQSSASVFEIDLLRPILDCIRWEISPSSCQAGGISGNERRFQERRLVDHLRALLFLVADGAPHPKKSGARSYLMQKLVRGTLTSMKLLEIPTDRFLPKIFHTISEMYTQQQPDLLAAQKVLMSYITDETERFEKTLRSATRHLDRILAERQGQSWLCGEDVLDLEKHYGMPLDLLNPLLRQKQLHYSQRAYHLAREKWQVEITKAQGL